VKLRFWLTLCLVAVAAGCATRENAPRARGAAGAPFTFVVLGDNRGDESGRPPAVFLECLRAIDGEAPSFVLNTGDMINGYT